jgi:hypothetical protein
MRGRHRLICSRSSDAEGGTAEASPCLYVLPTEASDPGTRDCLPARKSPPHPADETSDAFHLPGHGDVADGRVPIGVAFHASHHDLIARAAARMQASPGVRVRPEGDL